MTALLESAARERLPPRRPEAVLPRARAVGARALARRRRLRAPARPAPRGGRAGVELLRGPADRERQARLPPRAGARVQGRLPALPGDARPLRPAQGRLGLPRAAGRARGREGARDRVEGGDRGVRDRGVQRQVPRVGVPLRRGVEPADRADRLLGRPRRPVRDHDQRLHRVGLVGAAPDLGRGPALQGAQGRPVLPARRHRALLARGRPGLRGRDRPLGLRPAAGDRGARRRRDPREPGRGRRHRCSSGRRRRGR